MFNKNRNKKEYYSLRRFKGLGLVSAVVGLGLFGGHSALAIEITTGVEQDGGFTTITADGVKIKLKDSHVTVYNHEQDGYNNMVATSPSFQGFDRTVATEKEKQVLDREESKLKDESVENYTLMGDVTVDYKTKDNEIVKESNIVNVDTIKGVEKEKGVTSAVRGDFGRIIKGSQISVSDDSIKQGVSSSNDLSPTKMTKGGATYYKIDTRIDENKLEYSKDIEMNDVREKLTTQKLHNEDGSINYANIKNGAKVWVVEELEDGTYGKFTTITKTDATNDNSVISDFMGSLSNAQKFTDANVKAAGGIQKSDYLLVLERNTFARIEAVTSAVHTGLFAGYDVRSNPDSLIPSSTILNDIKAGFFGDDFVSKRDALKKIAELKKKTKEEAKDFEGRPTKNWTMEIGGTTSTDLDTATYEDTASLESAIADQESKFYNMYDAVNGNGIYKGSPIPLVGERKLTGNKDLTVDYIWNNSSKKPENLTPELRTIIENTIATVNEHKANQANAVYDTEIPEGVKFERIVVEIENEVDRFDLKQVNGVYSVTVQDSEGTDQSGSGLYGEYTVNGVKHRVRISNMHPFSVQPLLKGLFDTEYNDIYMVNRAYKKVDSLAHVTNIYAKEQSDVTEIRGTTTVKYVDEDGNVLKEDVTGPDGVVSTRTVKFYLDKDGQRQEISDETTPTNNTYDVSTAQYKPTSLEKDGKVYGYVRANGDETGKFINGNKEVTYVYKLKKAPLNVNYYLENTTVSLAPSENQVDLPVKSDYTTKVKTIEPKVEVQDTPEKTVTRTTTYELVATPDNANGKIVEGGTTVNYYYRAVVKEDVVMKKAPVLVNYFLDGTETKLADSDNQGQKEINSKYTTEAKVIPPKVVVKDLPEKTVTTTTTYELVKIPEDKDGIVPVGGKIVNYYYREVVKTTEVAKQAPVVANYYLEGTDTKLAPSDEQGQKDIGLAYTTETKSIEPKVEVQDLEDRTITKTTSYELVAEPTDKSGVVPVGGKVVNYFYRSVIKEDVVFKQAPVTVHYYKDGTTEKLADTIEQGKKGIGTKYTTEAPKVIEEKLVDGSIRKWVLKSIPLNANGDVKVGGVTVIYYYTEFSIPTDAPVVDVPEYNPPKETPKEEPKETPKEEPNELPKEVSKVVDDVKEPEPVISKKALPNTGSTSTNTVGLGLGIIAVGAFIINKRRKLDKREV